MMGDTDKAYRVWEKENQPVLWLAKEYMIIDKLINEYNRVAKLVDPNSNLISTDGMNTGATVHEERKTNAEE